DDDEDDEDERIGRFENGTQGRFVSFEVENSEINNHTYTGVNETVRNFEKITIGNFSIDEMDVDDHEIEIEGDEEGDDVELVFYDMANSLFKIDLELEEGTKNISFELGDLEVSETEMTQEKQSIVNLTYSDFKAQLISRTEGEEDEEEETSLGLQKDGRYLNYSAKGDGDAMLVFRMIEGKKEIGGEGTGGAEGRSASEMISKGIAEGEIGGEVSIEKSGNGYKQASVSYTRMNLMSRVEDNDRVRIMVSSKKLGDQGKIVIADISSNMVDVSSTDELDVKLDDKDLSLAEDYHDLLDTSDGSEYMLLRGQDNLQLLIMVPHFSTHLITIEQGLDSINDVVGDWMFYVPTVLISTGFIALSVLYKGRSGKKEPKGVYQKLMKKIKKGKQKKQNN
ncbi:MAG: hypothetical protein KGY76_00570, partial [Candidatus Thermoplasmatota archaeon]|nr:hypothetical protein [Candidatus Thermoplasmatota archaeon]